MEAPPHKASCGQARNPFSGPLFLIHEVGTVACLARHIVSSETMHFASGKSVHFCRVAHFSNKDRDR